MRIVLCFLVCCFSLYGQFSSNATRIWGRAIDRLPPDPADGAALIWSVAQNKFIFSVPAGSGDMLAANNLSELANKATARTNLQLGTIAVKNATVTGSRCAQWSADGTSLDSAAAACGTGGGLANVVEDLSPQLGANLDVNGFNVGGVTPTELG